MDSRSDRYEGQYRLLRAEGGGIAREVDDETWHRTLNISLPFPALTIRIARNNSWVRSMSMEDDGWIRWCGSDLRIYRRLNPRLGLEEFEFPRAIVRAQIRKAR